MSEPSNKKQQQARCLHRTLAYPAAAEQPPKNAGITVQAAADGEISITWHSPGHQDRNAVISAEYFGRVGATDPRRMILNAEKGLSEMLRHYPCPITVNGTPIPTKPWDPGPEVSRRAYGPSPMVAIVTEYRNRNTATNVGNPDHGQIINHQGVTYPLQGEVPPIIACSRFLIPAENTEVCQPNWQGMDTVIVKHKLKSTSPAWLEQELFKLPESIHDQLEITARENPEEYPEDLPQAIREGETYARQLTQAPADTVSYPYQGTGRFMYEPELFLDTVHPAQPIRIPPWATPVVIGGSSEGYIHFALESCIALAMQHDPECPLVPVKSTNDSIHPDTEPPFMALVESVTLQDTEGTTYVYRPTDDYPRFLTDVPSTNNGKMKSISASIVCVRNADAEVIGRYCLNLPYLTDGREEEQFIYLTPEIEWQQRELVEMLYRTYVELEDYDEGESDAMIQELSGIATYLTSGSFSATKEAVENTAMLFSYPAGGQERPRVAIASPINGNHLPHRIILTPRERSLPETLLDAMLQEAGVPGENLAEASERTLQRLGKQDWLAGLEQAVLETAKEQQATSE